MAGKEKEAWGWICWIRSLSDVAETWWDAGGIFACSDTDPISARCQNREGHSPLAIHTAAFVHVLVLLAPGLAFCFGEIINLTWLVETKHGFCFSLRKMVRHHTISWRAPSFSLLLAACVALLSALGTAWGWGVLKGSRICSWEATQPIPLHDLHSLVHKSFADLRLTSALERELLHSTLLL